MRKIRINELARELEVKPNRILELLPDLGVSEKKTHSSSIDEDVAIQVKRLLGFESRELSHLGSEDHHEDHEEEAAETEVHEGEMQLAEVPAVHEELAPKEAPAAATPPEPEPAVVRSHQPLRPPVLGLRPPVAPPAPAVQPPAPAPAAPVAHPAPAAPPPPQPPAAMITPAHPTPAQPGPPQVPAAPVPSQAPPQPPSPAQPSPAQPSPAVMPPLRNIPLAPRPAPGALRPGQILSGPRQPMPPSLSDGPRTPVVAPGAPKPGTPILQPSRPPQQPRPPQHQQHPQQHHQQQPPAAMMTSGGGAPGQAQARPQPPQQQSRPTLAGQPAARPVVPPRPDLVARLEKAKTIPSAPPSPRPGQPRPSPPVPGQPIYRGPIRPGQPIVRGPGIPGAPGGPAPGMPGRGPRPRPMHPTSPMRIEQAVPTPAEQQRRHTAKPGTRPVIREREIELEGKLRLPSRREQFAPPPIDREITISEGITVKELSEKLGIKANMVIKKLVERKVFATINQTLDVKLAEELSRDFGASTNKVSYEEETTQEIELLEETKDLVKRPPVVTIMGHVDHGKTSLLDAIRSANVAAKEAGGITQHIGAYHIEKNGRKIVFIDTPGHEAFTRMRARGAKVTDLVVLVVAADDGVMPQTLEAIDHARAAQVPILVAINKIDKPDAQPERIKQQLADRGLLSEDWGGETVMVPVSAKAKTNLDLLLEMILLVADMQDLRGNPTRPAMGFVLEAQLDRGRGPVPTVLVRNGTLHVGDFFICGQVFGKVRAMFDDRGNGIREAEPSMPVEVLGLDSMPDVGDSFQVVTDTAKAKQIVIYREAKAREQSMSKGMRVTLDQLHAQLAEGEIKDLNIILKTDVGGTAEVLSDTLQKLSNDKVRIRVLRAAVGAITESDVLLAVTSNAIIIGFNVRPERSALGTAEQEKVDIRLHTIIYEVTDEIKKAMAGLLEPVFKEVYRGRAVVREVFRISKVGTVAGCQVIDGVVSRDAEIRLLRDNVVIYTGKVDSLKRFKNDASEVKSGFECGIALTNYNDIKPADVIEAFATERVAAEALA